MSGKTEATPRDQATQALQYFQQSEYVRATTLPGKALLEKQTSEPWKDWAAARFPAGCMAAAEDGFRTALEVASPNGDAAINKETLPAGVVHRAEAIPLPDAGVGQAGETTRNATEKILQKCRSSASIGGQARRAALTLLCANSMRSAALRWRGAGIGGGLQIHHRGEKPQVWSNQLS